MGAPVIDRFLPSLFCFHAEKTRNNSRMPMSPQLVGPEDRNLQKAKRLLGVPMVTVDNLLFFLIADDANTYSH